MHFGFSDEQERIRHAAQKMLARRVPLSAVAAAADSGNYDEALWNEFVSLDWPALTVGERHGGVGLGLVEAVAVIEQVGYALAPSPLLSDICAALLIDAAGTEEQREVWLPQIAAGLATATLGVVGTGGNSVLPDADRAAALILVDGRQANLSTASEVAVEPFNSVDRTRRFGCVTAMASVPLSGDVTFGVAQAEVALSADLTGVAQRALDMTIAYVKQREAFGRPIGAFQGISHRCAEMFSLTESARSATYFAAWAAGAEPEKLPLAASMAKASAADAARKVTAMAIQAHGAMGFTWDAGLHWLLKRAHSDAAQLISADSHWREIGRIMARSVSPLGPTTREE